MVRSQITPLDADWFILQHISLSPVHSRHSQTSVSSGRLKKNGASTARITHQIHATRSKYPISTKKRKRVAKKEKAETKPKTKKIKQEPEGKIEVQVLEEGEIFYPDVYLDELAQQWHPLPPSAPQTSTRPFRNPSPPPRGSPVILYSCPVHLNDTLQKKETDTRYGHWKYYKCPVQNCFVSCGVDNVEYYLESAKCQVHNFYLAKPVHVMKCYCKRPLAWSCPCPSQRRIQGDYS